MRFTLDEVPMNLKGKAAFDFDDRSIAAPILLNLESFLKAWLHSEQHRHHGHPNLK